MDLFTYEEKAAMAVGLIIGVAIAATVWGFVIRYIMKTKGYQNLGAWFCCGFFLGIIGLVIAITRPDLKNQPFQNGNPYGSPYANPYGQPMQPPILNEQNAVLCPHCLELTPNSSQFCIKCGCKLN